MISYFSLSVILCLVAARTRRHRPRAAHRKLSRTLEPIKALQENLPTVTEILGSFSDSIGKAGRAASSGISGARFARWHADQTEERGL